MYVYTSFKNLLSGIIDRLIQCVFFLLRKRKKQIYCLIIFILNYIIISNDFLDVIKFIHVHCRDEPTIHSHKSSFKPGRIFKSVFYYDSCRYLTFGIFLIIY